MLARSVKFTRHYLTQWILKPPGSYKIYWVRQYLENVFWIKYLYTFEMTIKLKSNLYVRSVNIFLIFDTVMCVHTE